MIKKVKLQKCKLVLVAIFSFLLGCMLTINLVPLDRTCKIDNTDRGFNIMGDSKLKSPELIILILSSPENVSKRSTVRETWLKLKDRGHTIDGDNLKFRMKHYFVIGGLGLSAETSKNVNKEQLKYNDILILPMRDNYNNLTYKVMRSFEWLKEQYEVGFDFKYVLKCDDDSFVRIDSLVHEMAQIELIYLKSDLLSLSYINDNTSPYLRVNVQTNKNNFGSNNLQLYWGYFNGDAKIKSKGKWKEDSWILCDNYLPYALGGGYLLSRGLVTFLAQNADYAR